MKGLEIYMSIKEIDVENKFLTVKEITQIVYNHLKTQVGYAGKKYRNRNGLKCAIGCLIPDNEYNDCIEGIPISELSDGPYIDLQNHKVMTLREILFRSKVNIDDEDTYYLALQLQEYHDDTRKGDFSEIDDCSLFRKVIKCS